MMTINFNPFPVLETDRLILRKPELTDIDEMFKYRSDPQLMQYIMHRYSTERSQVEEMMTRIHRLIDNNEGINWAVTKKGDDTIIGMVGYVHFVADHFRGEIGYMMHTPHHGTGIAREATKAAIDYGFNVLGLHSIEAIINHENVPSKRLVEKLGFSNDAFFKDYLFVNGKFVSANVYSLVKE